MVVVVSHSGSDVLVSNLYIGIEYRDDLFFLYSNQTNFCGAITGYSPSSVFNLFTSAPNSVSALLLSNGFRMDLVGV